MLKKERGSILTGEYLNILNRYISQASETMCLRPGVERGALSILEKSIAPLRIGMDLQELFLRCGGAGGNDMFFGDSNFMSLKDSLAEYAQFKSLCYEIGVTWPDALFPVGSTQSTMLVLLRQEDFIDSEIYMFYPGNGDMTIYKEYDCLLEMFEALLQPNLVADSTNTQPTYDLTADKRTMPSDWYL